MRKRIFANIRQNLWIYICIAVYFITATFRLKYPAPNYDETFYMNSALGPVDDTFAYVHIGSFPIMVMTYIGALKPWIYAPIYKLFGVTMYSIRLPNILITCLSLWITYKTVRQEFGKFVANLSLLLLVIDPSLINLTRVDYGPVVLSLVLRSLTLFFFFRLIRKQQKKDILFILICLILGFYNKLNFIWFITSFMVSGSFVYFKEMRSIAMEKFSALQGKVLIFWAIIFALLLPYILWRLDYLKTIDLFYFKHLIQILNSYLLLFNGQIFYLQSLEMSFIDKFIPVFGLILSFFILGVAILHGLIKIIDRKITKPHLFFILLSLGILSQIIITSAAGGSWHLLMVYPYVTVLFSAGLMYFFKEKKRILSVLLICIASYFIFINYQYNKNYDNPNISYAWSKATYELIDYTKKSDSVFVCVDWGIQTQLQAFDHKKGKYFDEWPKFIQDSNEKKIQQYLLKNFYFSKKTTLFILIPEKYSTFKQPRKTFFRYAKENGLIPNKILDIKDKEITIFEIYQVW